MAECALTSCQDTIKKHARGSPCAYQAHPAQQDLLVFVENKKITY